MGQENNRSIKFEELDWSFLKESGIDKKGRQKVIDFLEFYEALEDKEILRVLLAKIFVD